jgi:hypothetical protein
MAECSRGCCWGTTDRCDGRSAASPMPSIDRPAACLQQEECAALEYSPTRASPCGSRSRCPPSGPLFAARRSPAIESSARAPFAWLLWQAPNESGLVLPRAAHSLVGSPPFHLHGARRRRHTRRWANDEICSSIVNFWKGRPGRRFKGVRANPRRAWFARSVSPLPFLAPHLVAMTFPGPSNGLLWAAVSSLLRQQPRPDPPPVPTHLPRTWAVAIALVDVKTACGPPCLPAPAAHGLWRDAWPHRR